MKIAYLAHPIDLASQAQHVQTVLVAAAIQTHLKRRGWDTYTPGNAWDVGSGVTHPGLQDVNNLALHLADVVVAYLPAGVPTIGVPMEIERARMLGTPVVVFTDTDRSYALAQRGITVINLPTVFVPGEDGLGGAAEAFGNALTDAVVQAAKRDREDVIKVKLTEDGAQAPTRVYEDDAGVDLHIAHDYTIEPGEFRDLATTVEAVQLPPERWGLITGRSSTLRQHRLHVPLAVIDPGWRGALFVGAWNLGGNPVTIKAGQRIGQLILMPLDPAAIRIVQEVDPHDRGVKGFGSTGS